MRTTARRDGDQWVVSGTKQFITHGRLAGLVVVIAVTDPAKRTHGMSAFVVPRETPGLRAGRKENKLGMRASDTSEVVFEDCRVPADALIGQEGEGFIQTMQVLDGGRVGIAALAVGLAQGAYDAAMAHALTRRQFGRPIAEFQAIRWKMADMATRLEAARWLTYRAAWLRDHPEDGPATSSSIAKLYATETAVRAADECVQIHGGYGFVKDYPAEKYFRDVKLCTIGEGTSEIQRLVIARSVLGRL
jgi:alkylation response protein AidB-like acyl-CoA dehydrogenase